MDKCRYPECTLCIDNCMMGAINFKNNPPGISANCANCSLCDKLCPNHAIIPDEATLAARSKIVVNKSRCKYPECTLCLDHCPMDCLDLTQKQPAANYHCEVCCLCWTLCPEGAIDIPNLDVAQKRPAVETAEGRAQMKDFTHLMERDELTGKFRRHFPADKVDIMKPVKLKTEIPRLILEDDWTKKK
jgi:NAD-dependent dihydropyrimidine dehydrogenase PreA subunit